MTTTLPTMDGAL